MSNWAEFLRMGGYGGFVWSAYAVAVVVLAANFIVAWGRKRRRLKKIRDKK